MTDIEKAKALLREADERIQDEFIDDLLCKVEFLLDKASKKGYEPTEHERVQFGRIVTIIINMNLWF